MDVNPNRYIYLCLPLSALQNTLFLYLHDFAVYYLYTQFSWIFIRIHYNVVKLQCS